jgi:hypothetical protein
MHCILHVLALASFRFPLVDLRLIRTMSCPRINICSLHAIIISLSKLLVLKVDLIISSSHFTVFRGEEGLTFKYLICQIAAPTRTPI